MSDTNGSHGSPDARPPVTFEPSWVVDPPKQRPELTRRYVVMFVLTVYTTILAGMQMTEAFQALAAAEGMSWRMLYSPSILALGVPFSATLIAILGIHEMGHYVASRIWHVRATLPYFIPFPTMIGTLGAVIRIKSRIPNRRALMDIGAAGPIAGLIPAVIALAYGLSQSRMVAVGTMGGEGHYVFGDSLLTGWIQSLVVGPMPEGYDLFIHPVGFAGWLGLFVTVLNLLPVGQFDGGHIVYALLGRRQHLVSRATIVGLLLFYAAGPSYDWLGAADPFSVWLSSRWPGWLVWAFLAMLLGRRHPPTLDPSVPLGSGRLVIGLISLLIFAVCFIPSPISYVSP